MKKLLILTTCLAIFATGATHAGKGPPKDEAERAARMERMKSHLQLTDEQVAEIQQIRADGGGRDEIRGVLTDEQKETWDQHRQAHRGNTNKNSNSQD